MRSIAAAIPLALALLGTGLESVDPGSEAVTRMRLAPSAAVSFVRDTALDEDELRWLGEHNPYGMPEIEIPGSHTLVVREGYTLAHNNVDLVADWVAFRLTAAFVQGDEKRPGTSAFKPDPLLDAGGRAELADYKGWKGVYDRGHQCAFADSRGRGVRVGKESFYLSNMTPQCSRLNQTGWRLLEERIQDLAVSRNELWVITGPAYVDDDGDGIVEYGVIGDNQVAVPTHYYKIVVAKAAEDDDALEAMAFLVPNVKMEGEFDDYLVEISEIEELTGIDFLSGLPDPEEEALESVAAEAVWES